MKGISDILRVEQSHSLIDLYETFVAFIQEIIRRDDLEQYRDVALKCIRTLTDVTDFRLVKAVLVIESHGSLESRRALESLDKRRSDISDALFSGNVKLAALIARRSLGSASCLDPWQLIYAGFAFGHGSRERVSKYGRPQDISRLLGGVLSRGGASVYSLAVLTKLAANLRGLPTSVGVMDLLQQVQRSRPEDELRPWFIGLNSPSVGVEDLSPKGALFGATWFTPTASSNQTEIAWSCFHNAAPTGAGNFNLSTHLFTAAGLVRNGQYQNATDLIRTNGVHRGPEPVRALAVSVMLHANFAAGDRSSVVNLIADEGARGEAHRQLLPVRLTLESYHWSDYKILSSPLSAPIALHLLWLENEREETASLLRFSVREILKNLAVQRPSKLYDQAGNYPVHQLIYFLSKVCVPNILDVSRVLKSTREVMEERQAVCASLRFLDPANASDYQQEILSINNQQTMDEGKWIVDRTRIHVDTDALRRWASKELSEDYSRYRDLMGVDVGPDVDLDDLLKDAMTEATFKRMSFVPETEADMVLIDILGRIKEEFLNNASFGLDFYLSKRIRHQSFIGLIRGPLEFSNLITTRESGTGIYHRNDGWLVKFANASAEAKEAISDAFSKCAAKFDDTLISAKDTSFQIRSQEQPAGLVFLDLSPQLILLIRAFARTDETLSDFMDTAVIFLWTAIEPSLAQVRRFILEDLKTKVVDAFDELRATVKKHAEDKDPTFLELDLAIGGCSADVQRALDDAAQWFNRVADISAGQRSFELEQMVKIAIDSALKCQRAFEPEISCEVKDGQTRMSARTLVFVHDVIFVALDNVRAHSNLKKPKVKILADVNVEAGTFTVDVRNEMKVQSRAATEMKLREIRGLIEAGAYGRRTRSEGGSGLLKLAAEMRRSSEGRIDFGFNDVEEFQLTVVDSLMLQAVPPGGNHE